MRFAFYGRVSTEDQQDPESSRGWQIARAKALVEPQGGEIVAEFFDIGQSRSLPWKRRPEAAALLAEIARPDRTFDAIVVGELARAFGDAMDREVVTRTLEHWHVDLWHPDAAGRHDRFNVGHRITAALRAELAQEERETIRRRVKDAMRAQAATEGRFLGGRPPYGYRLADAGPHPNPSKAAAGQRMHRLEADPVAAPIVGRIFDDFLAGHGLYAIAERLTAEGIPSPSAHDPARNRHRTGVAWSKSAVRAILQNPRYTGRQVWNRQRRDEVLMNVDDTALGYQGRMRWNDRADWVWSAEVTHDALVTPEVFAAAQEVRGVGRHRPAEKKIRRTSRPYVLRSLVFCGVCGRKMTGQWNNGKPHYRCRYPSEYALANKVEHPRTVYVREDHVTPGLDQWLASVFDPERIDATCEAIAAASEPDEGAAARVEAAQRKLADCDTRLAKYRAALEAGADATVVAAWMAEVKGERMAAEAVLRDAPTAQTLTEADVRQLVAQLGDIVKVLAEADPIDKAALYAELGVRLTYNPDDRSVVVEARPEPCALVRVGGGT